MNLHVIAVGKIKESYIRKGLAEYSKRLTAYGKLKIVEVKEESFSEPLSEKEINNILDKEGERILQRIPDRSMVIALDRLGDMVSSERLAQRLTEVTLHGKSTITWIIGGSFGLSPEVINRADWSLSFSHMTFPHQLMRLILLEQLYRVCTIIRGEKYHK